MIRLNSHIESLKPSATLAINEKVKDLRAAGKSVCHFGFGQSPFPVHPQIIAALSEHAQDNTYLPSLGLPELRKQIAEYLKKYHNLTFESDLILIGPGSKELLFQTVMILDHTFLIPQGSWVSYLPQIKAKGGRSAILKTQFQDQYKLRPDTLKTFCESHKKERFVLILNSPNNPSGAVYSSSELKKLGEVCREFGVLVLSDEIYARICFASSPAPSIAEYYPEGTLVFSGLSKIFSAGGYRCGFMAIPENLRTLQPVFQSLFSETFSAVASPIQYAAMQAFTPSTALDAYVRRNTEVLKQAAQYVYHHLSALRIRCTKPEGAFYMLIDLQHYQQALSALGLNSSEDIAMHLLEHFGVALLPGSDFYFDPSRAIFRLAFVDFKDALFLANVEEGEMGFELEKHAPNLIEGVKRIGVFCESLKTHDVG